MYIENLVIPVSNVSPVAHKQSSTGRSLDMYKSYHSSTARPFEAEKGVRSWEEDIMQPCKMRRETPVIGTILSLAGFRV